MEDAEIVELYWQRNEEAIKETENKYGLLLMKLAYNILNNTEDSREAVNDTYYRAWCTMPENRPQHLSSYLSHILRGLAIDIWRSRHREKREASLYAVSLDELKDVVSDTESTESIVEGQLLMEEVSRFLKTLPPEERGAFMGRYYYCDSVKDIAGYLGVNEARVKHILFKVRKNMKAWLKKEGYDL